MNEELLTAVETARAAFEPGWYPGLSMEDYLQIPAMSASGLELMRRSAAHYRHAQITKRKRSAAMDLGTAVHLALLEPELFAGHYVVLEPCSAVLKSGDRKGDKCGKTSNALRDGLAFCGTHDPNKDEETPASLHLISAESMEAVEAMKAAVLAHPEALEFFRGKGHSELTGVWRDKATGVLCKIRLDRQVSRAEHVHADLKSTTDASEDAFIRQAGRMGYHRKAQWYRRGLEALGKPASASVLIAVESIAPHGCQTFLLDEDQLRVVGTGIDRLLQRYAQCLEADEWPAYDSGYRDLRVKPWDLPEQPQDWSETELSDWEEAADWNEMSEVGQ